MARWCLVALLLGYAIADLFAIQVWRSDEALWSHAYSVSPAAPRVALNYARVLLRQGRVSESAALVNLTPPQ